MKYILMCGGRYEIWEKPRHLSVICGEEIVERTIRLLKENGVTDIAISSNNDIFKKFGIPVLEHNNNYVSHNFGDVEGDWFDAFYPTDEPTCYIFGDVVFSPEAIKTIVEYKTDDMMFFGSKPPFASNYIKNHEEPFALKVVNQKHLREAINKTRELDKEGKFWRKPLMWELWTVIQDVPLQTEPGKYPAEYVAINDYTVDVDRKSDIAKINILLGGIEMVKAEVIKQFTLGKFNELKNVIRADVYKNEDKTLYVGDTFECTEDMYKYLSGNNAKGEVVIKLIEVIPAKVEKPIETKVEPKKEIITPIKPKKKPTIKKNR